MGKTNMQLLQERAAMLTSDLNTAGILSVKQVDKFLVDAVEDTVILKEVSRKTMSEKKHRYPKMWTPARFLQAATEATAPAETTKPNFGNFELDCVEVIGALDITRSTLEDNPEKAKLKAAVMKMMSQKAGLDLEDLALNGDTASADTFLAQQDGWLKRITTNIYDHGAAAFEDDIFFEMLKKLDQKYLRDRGSWRIYVHPLIEMMYRKALQSRGTALGDTAVLESGALKYMGVPIVGVPQIPVTGSGDTATSPALLVHPQNLVVGVHREMTVDSEWVPRKRLVEITFSMRPANNVQWEGAAVKALNIKHSLA